MNLVIKLSISILIFFSALAQANAIATAEKVIGVVQDSANVSRLSSNTSLRFKVLARIGVKDLNHHSRAGNIDMLIDKGVEAGKINQTKMLTLRAQYNQIEHGDRILLNCLKHPQCDPEEAISIAQKSPLHAMVVEKHPSMSLTLANHKIGQIGEVVMAKIFTESGWKQIPGEVGRNGIDGLFIKRDKSGNIIDVIFAESKYNTSKLKLTKADGQQMSKTWLLAKIKRLESAHPDNPDYKVIKKLVEQDQYRSRLISTTVKDGKLNVSIKSIHDKGGRVALGNLTPSENMKGSFIRNREIDLNNPLGDFQKQIVSSFYSVLN